MVVGDKVSIDDGIAGKQYRSVDLIAPIGKNVIVAVFEEGTGVFSD